MAAVKDLYGDVLGAVSPKGNKLVALSAYTADREEFDSEQEAITWLKQQAHKGE